MVRHCVLFRWKSNVTKADIDRVSDLLRSLPSSIPQIRSFCFGPDLGLVEDNYDFAVVAEFDGESDYQVYAQHPQHLKVVGEGIKPLLEERVAVQHRTDTESF